ncbi:MAG: hypothetical protein QOH03_3102 [Kribbellaceae bacterium]|nr:hypothetical protein [Kribbellaceae bacterium]
MIWLTWRQFRVQALVIAAAVAVLAIFLATTGPGLLHEYHLRPTDFLKRISFDHINQYLYYAGQVAVYAAPAVIGAFWGAPLIARELEAGTHRLVWNQSISRTRWLATKLAVTGLAGIAVTGLLSLAVTWWADPIDDAIGGGQTAGPFTLPRLLPAVFGARGVVPIGYAAFAVALGVVVGLFTRRSVVAIAITLTVVIAAQILSPLLLRPHLMTPVVTTVLITDENMRGLQMSGPDANPEVMRVEVILAGQGNWELSDRTVNSAGVVQNSLPSWMADCAPPPPGVNGGPTKAPRAPLAACFKRLGDEGYRQRLTYQPADRFWDLQWREFGVFLLLAGALTGLCFWRIRRDLS